MESVPPYMKPFVLPVDGLERDRRERYDLYLPAGQVGRSPAIVFLHGLYSAAWRPAARDWPTYVGYGSTAASYGAVGVVVELPLHEPSAYPRAAEVLAAVTEEVRQDRRIDGDRVAMWAFSGGALLTASWLAGSSPWLRCVALSYPVLAPLPGWDVDRVFRPADALTAASPPMVLTRVGRDYPDVAATVPPFLEKAERLGVSVEVLDVPDGQHSFDSLDHTEASRDAVRSAFQLVTDAMASRSSS